jgi:hypothetical protein
VFGRFIGVILDKIAYALGVILFSAAVVSGVFASAGLAAVRGNLGDEQHQLGLAVSYCEAL